MSSKNDSQDKKILSDATNSFDLLEYNNIYDDLNPYFINSFDMVDVNTSNSEKNNRDLLKVVSTDDEIYFVHNGPVSARHQQIHDTKETSTSSSKKTSSKKKTSTLNTPKKVNDIYDAKKKEIKERLNNKTHSQTAKSSSEITNRQYTSNQYKSKPAVENYSNKKQEKKNSNGCLIFIIFIFLFGSSILSSCMEFVGDTISDFTNSYNIESLLNSNESNEDVEYYEGAKEDLTTIYEEDDLNNEHPYYYDFDGNLYDEKYAMIDNYSDLNFTQQTIATIQLLETTSIHSNDKDFITAFIEPGTYKIYYVIGYKFYDVDDNEVDSSEINVPTNVSLKILDYFTNRSSQN